MLNTKNDSHTVNLIILTFAVDWGSKSTATPSVNLTMINLIFGRPPCITAEASGIMNGLCSKSDPRCTPCCRRPPCTCALPIEEPTPQHSHSLCDYSASSLEWLVFWIMIRLPWVNHSHIVSLHLNASKKCSIGLFSIPSQLQYRSASFSLILNRRML